MAVNEVVLAEIDPRVVHIKAEHVEDADRLFRHVWSIVPKIDEPKDYATLPRGTVYALTFGAIAIGRQIVHAPFMHPHARVGDQLYKLKSTAQSAERAIELIGQVRDQHNLGWGVNVDANDILDVQNQSGDVMRTLVDFRSVGLWRREERMPRLIREVLGVIR